MRKLSLWMQITLDGYTEGKNGEFDWPIVEPELHQYFLDELSQAGMFVYGRRVWEGMAAYWPTADADPNANPFQAGYARLWRPMPKLVLSRTLIDADWNTTILADNIATTIEALKCQPGGDIFCFGGSTAAATLIDLDLIDEYRLNVHPVVLGAGSPLFPSQERRDALRLVSARTFDDAVVHLRYERRR
jgi:dihydrofolate reductase